MAYTNQQRGILQETGHLGKRGAIDDGLDQSIAGLAQLAGINPAKGALLDQLLVAQSTWLDTRDATQTLVGLLLAMTGHGDGAASGNATKEAQGATATVALANAAAALGRGHAAGLEMREGKDDINNKYFN